MTTPKPPIPANVDLRDFAFMPLDVARLRDSDLAALATAEEFRAAVMLWCASWHQVPAGSLPDDAQALTHLAGLGRDIEAFENVRRNSMRHFRTHSDGRLYHPVICAKAMEAWGRKEEATERREADRQRKREAREAKAKRNQGARPTGQPEDILGTSAGSPPGRPPEVRSKTGTGTGTKEKTPEPAKLMVDIWNQVCVEASLAKVKKLHTSRTRKLEKRLAEDFRGLIVEWEAYCKQIAASPFLTGRNDRGWKADLDWVVEPRNFAKIIEGKYDNPDGANGHDQGPYRAEGEEDLRTDYRRLMRWQANREWMPHWGPEPGEPGCLIAAQVMTQHGQRTEPDA